MTDHLPECPKSGCDACYEQGQRDVFALHPEWTTTGLCKPDCAACRRLTELITEWAYGYEKGLDAARQAIAATHQPMPVIQCECGWGVNCPECGPESNRTVGSVCRVCCDDWGDHGYCSDMHNLDDSPFHHVGDAMWTGPYCPVIAALAAIKGDQP